MRASLLSLLLISSLTAEAQQVDWLTSWPMNYNMNPGMPDQALASAPGRLVGMRTVSTSLIYGQEVYGDVAIDALDPVTSATLLSCLLADSVAVDAAAVDATGIAYFSGRFVGDVLEICDGSLLQGVGGFLTENHFLLAWDLDNGLILWTRNLNLAHPDATEVPSLAIDPDGNLWYVFQEFFSGAAVRVDANGDDVETRPIDGIRRFGTLSFDPWGGLYVSGSCENGTLNFGGQSFLVNSTQGYNMFVLRFAPDGTAGFAEFADDVTFQNPTVVATSDGHAYLAGDMLDSTNWGGIAFNGPNWVFDIFIAKLDSTGQFLWGTESAPSGGPILGDMFRAKGPSVAVDADDNPYLIGTLRGLVDWGNGVVSDGLTLGVQCMSIVSFAPDGTPQWAATSQPTGMFHQSQTLTALADGGALHFAGQLTGDFTFSPHSTNTGGAYAAMVGRMEGLSTAVGESDRDEGVLLYPSPTSDRLFIRSSRPVRSLSILTPLGGLTPARPDRDGWIDVHALAPGFYLLRAELDDGRVVSRAFVKE